MAFLCDLRCKNGNFCCCFSRKIFLKSLSQKLIYVLLIVSMCTLKMLTGIQFTDEMLSMCIRSKLVDLC
uniref:Uncharacterized protein LOC103493478 isoform X2 n=1 Tax=Rhizophora mucronata TaxID=61149 RepID=A0A2P2KZK1_RHIMU